MNIIDLYNEATKKNALNENQIKEMLMLCSDAMELLNKESTITYNKAMRDIYGLMFNSHYIDYNAAKADVDNMYHFDNQGEKICGMYFSMEKTKQIFEEKSAEFSETDTEQDLFVALNAFYHDLVCTYMLYNSDWEKSLIDSSIAFFFKDNDFNKEGKGKIYDYISCLFF